MADGLQRRWAYIKKPLPTDSEEEQGDNAAAALLAGDNDALAARFQYALQKVQECHDELYNIRRAPFSNATDLDSNARGRLRVEKLDQRTQQLTAAEDEYRTYRDQALEARAISEHHQSSRFRDWKDNGYGKKSLALRGRLMQLSRAKHVQGWVEKTTGERAKDAPGSPKQRDRASKGNLWEHLTSVIRDKDPNDTAIDRSRIHLDEWRRRNVLEKDCSASVMARGDGKERTSQLMNDTEYDQLLGLYPASRMYIMQRYIFDTYIIQESNVSLVNHRAVPRLPHPDLVITLHRLHLTIRPPTSRILAE